MYENWLRSFHAVASTGGFTSASRSLNLSQPTITEQVKLLEHKFGVELFYRTGRTTELTETGQSLFRVTQNIVGHVEEAIELLSTEHDFPSGNFTIGSVSPYGVMSLVKTFQEKFPGLTPSVAVYHRHEILERLLSFQIDAAIIGRAGSAPRFYNVPYRTHQVYVLVPARHKWAKRKSITTADLRDAPMILRESKSTTRAAFKSAMRKAGVPYRTVMEIDNREAIREAVALGMGYGLASNDGIHSLPKDRLKIIPVSDAEMQIGLHIVCLKNRRDRPLIKAFIETALAQG